MKLLSRDFLEELSNQDSFGFPEGEVELDFDGTLLKYENWNRGCFNYRMWGIPSSLEECRELASTEGAAMTKAAWLDEMRLRGYKMTLFKHDSLLGEAGMTYALFRRKK
jgi:hypothetical protein